MNIEALRELSGVLDDLRDAEDRVKALKETRDALEAPIVEEMIEEGVQRVNVDGATLYVRHDLFARLAEGVTSEKAIGWLTEHTEYQPYLPKRINWPGLSALLRERRDEGQEEVPSELKEIIEAHRKVSIRKTKS